MPSSTDGSARASDLADRFGQWTGRRPEGVWRAPGRVNLIGEHLDYNGGHVLPFALERSTWVAVSRRRDGVLRARSTRYREVLEVPVAALAGATGWGAYLAGVMWALGPDTTGWAGADVMVDSDVPAGSGLSSSAALECAWVLALADLGGLDTASPDVRRHLAAVAQHAEVTVVGAPVGIMDQTVSLLAVEGHALYLDTRTLDFEQVPLHPVERGYRLLIVDTGSPHTLATNGYRDRRLACEAAAHALGVEHLAHADPTRVEAAELTDPIRRRARHVVTEEARTAAAVVALRRSDFDELGRLMTESHASMARDFENSTPALDAVVAASLEAGAAGARMTGGGWGGAAIMLVGAARVDAVTQAIERALAGADGAPHPVDVLEVRPSAGAARMV